MNSLSFPVVGGLVFLSLIFLGLVMPLWIFLHTGIRVWQRYVRGFTESTEYRLTGLFLFTDSRKILVLYTACLAAGPALVYLLFHSLVFVFIVLGVLLIAPRVILSRLEIQRRKSINEALPDMLAQLAGSMQAGSTLTIAIETVTLDTKGPVGQEFSLLLREQKLGISIEDALDNLAERVQSEEVDLMVAAALIAHDVGGNLSEILLRLSTTLRKKIEMEGRIRALTAQGVLQGWVVSLLPFAILSVLWFIETEAVTPIYKSALGWVFLLVMFILQVTGGLMIRKIVSIDV